MANARPILIACAIRPYLSLDRVAAALGVEAAWLRANLKSLQGFPAPSPGMGRRWHPADIEHWQMLGAPGVPRAPAPPPLPGPQRLPPPDLAAIAAAACHEWLQLSGYNATVALCRTPAGRKKLSAKFRRPKRTVAERRQAIIEDVERRGCEASVPFDPALDRERELLDAAAAALVSRRERRAKAK